jgi:hypothetical protein
MREIQKLSNTDQLLLDCCNSSLFQIEQAKGKDLENAKLEYLMNAFQSMINQKKQALEHKIYSTFMQLEQDLASTCARLNEEWESLRKMD